MIIHIDTKKRLDTSELLKKEKQKVSVISEKITDIRRNLYSKISDGNKDKLRSIVSTLDDIARSSDKLSTKISNGVYEYERLEKKHSSSIYTLSEKIGKAVAAVAAGAATAAGATSSKQTATSTAASAVESAKKVEEVAKETPKAVKQTGAKTSQSWFTKAVNFIGDAVDSVINWFRGVQATIVSFAMSIVEGLLNFVEAIGDLVIMVGGAVASAAVAVYDTAKGLATGDWDYSNIGSMWSNGIMPAVGYSWSTAAFDALYETEPFKQLEEKTWGPFKRKDGIMYKVGKKVGYYVGVAVVSAVTCGAGGAALTGTTTIATVAGHAITVATPVLVTAGVTAAAKIGAASEENYNTLVDKKAEDLAKEELIKAGIENPTDDEIKAKAAELRDGVRLDGGEIFKAVGTATAQGIVDGAFVVAGGAASQTLQGTKLFASSGKVGQYLLKSGSKNLVDASKAFASEGVGAIMDGEYDANAALQDFTGSLITSTVADSVTFKTGQLYDKAAAKFTGGTAAGATAATAAAKSTAEAAGKIGNIDVDDAVSEGAKGIKEASEATAKEVQKGLHWDKQVFVDQLKENVGGKKLAKKTTGKAAEKYTEKYIIDPIVEEING